MIHLIIGNTGSGKTTYSNELKKKNNGVIFSIDKWNNTLFLPDKKQTDGLEWFLERIERAETIILNLIDQLEASKIDSILDLGLSKLEHREKFRKFEVLIMLFKRILAVVTVILVILAIVDGQTKLLLASITSKNINLSDFVMFEFNKL